MKPRILIVDDDPGTLASLSRAFALEGYEAALTAPSAARALERLLAEPVDASSPTWSCPRWTASSSWPGCASRRRACRSSS